MKPLLVLSLLSCSAVLALEQTTVDYGHIAITADRQEKDGAFVRCKWASGNRDWKHTAARHVRLLSTLCHSWSGPSGRPRRHSCRRSFGSVACRRISSVAPEVIYHRGLILHSVRCEQPPKAAESQLTSGLLTFKLAAKVALP